MTLTLTSVLTPIAVATGRTGRRFIEFALALAGASLVSGFVALTLSPMMCSLLLRHEEKHSWLYNTIERWLEAMTDGYRRALTATLRARWIIVAVWVAVAAVGAMFFTVLKSELAPLEDRGVILGGPENLGRGHTRPVAAGELGAGVGEGDVVRRRHPSARLEPRRPALAAGGVA